MGVLILDMKFPKTCAACEWSRYSFPNAWCGRMHKTTDIEIAKNGRPDDCPLVPVPQHGKLVDVTDVKELWEKHFGDDQIAFQLIDYVPVIIPPKSKEQQDLEDLVERLNREGIAP